MNFDDTNTIETNDSTLTTTLVRVGIKLAVAAVVLGAFYYGNKKRNEAKKEAAPVEPSPASEAQPS